MLSNAIPLKPNPAALIDAYPDLAGADMLWALPVYNDRLLVGYEVMGVFLPTGGEIEPLFEDAETRKWRAMVDFWLNPPHNMTEWERLFYGEPARAKGMLQ